MKTIRLLYPDFAGGGLETYWFGAHLLAHILPPNEAQPLVRVDIDPPDGSAGTITDGIHAKDQILRGIRDAAQKIRAANPDRIITIGGNCLVSQAPFDYLHGKYERTGIIWIDAHPAFPHRRTAIPTPMPWFSPPCWAVATPPSHP